MDFDEAIDFLIENYRDELIECVCENFYDEVQEYFKP